MTIKNCIGIIVINISHSSQTSLLRRLQAQPHPDEVPPSGEIYPFSKMALPFEPLMGF